MVRRRYVITAIFKQTGENEENGNKGRKKGKSGREGGWEGDERERGDGLPGAMETGNDFSSSSLRPATGSTYLMEGWHGGVREER